MAGGIRDGKGRILKNTEPFFSELAENYPSDQYTSFCNEFGVGYNQAEHIRKDQHLGNMAKALEQVLNKWVTDDKEVTRQKIESALKNARTGGLINIVRRHFEKNAEVEESHDEAGTSQSDATQTKNLAASNTGTSIAMAGNTFTVNFAAETAENLENRKRNVDAESDGAATKKSANENTMSMTKRHRQILLKSAHDLLEDLDTDDVSPYLLGDGVITTDDAAKVNAKSTRKEKVTELLEILPRRGDRAFDAFLKSLEKTKGSKHLYHAVKRLEETYEEQDTFMENDPTSQAKSTSSDQPSGSGRGNTVTQRDVNLTINASGHGSVQNNKITGQINNVTL